MSRWRRAVAAVGCLSAWAACQEDTGLIVELDAIRPIRPQLRDIVVQVWNGGTAPVVKRP